MASTDELWLVDFGDPFPGEPAHHRPAMVVGPPGIFGSDFPFVLLCPLTTARRGLSLHIEVEASPGSGLDATSYIQCELLRSVNRRRLAHRLGVVDTATSDRVHDVVLALLGH